MQKHARVVVIGGGVVGASVLYHLAKRGWKDVLLIERKELAAGSSWHAAGAIHTLNGDPNVAQLQKYTVELYKEIQEISGHDVGLHMTGGIVLAGSKERMDWLRLAHGRGRYLGMDTEIITPAEAKKVMPLIDEKYFVGALYDPFEGYIAPEGVVQAYGKAAKVKGAELSLRNRVLETNQRADGTWDVVTEQGTVHAEIVINCGGLWAREVGRMAGLELPVLAMEHHYIITEDMPEVIEANKSMGKEIPVALDCEGEMYLRQERMGMLLGTYEPNCRPWSPREAPWTFDRELLPHDMDRIAPMLEVGFTQHFPAFQKAGIRTIVNGPFTFAPDGNPLVGPVRGLQNYWVACGVMAGFCQGGGVGLAISNWLVDGDPGYDIWGMDVARYGDWANLNYTNAKVRENYARRFRIRFPNEELPVGRPHKTTPIYEQLKSHGAVMGDAYGLEHSLWFAPKGEKAEDIFSFRRSNDFKHVGAECAAVRGGVGLLEISNFAKYRVTEDKAHPGAAEAWLNHILANRVPKVGRMVLTPMLNEFGRIIGDFTLANLNGREFYIFGSGIAQQYHMRWFEHHAVPGVRIEQLDLGLQGLQIAGPKARDLLMRLVEDVDVSNTAMSFMSFRAMNIGHVPALVGRVTFTGELGYEMWVKPEYMRSLYDLIWKCGADLGLKHFGGRALNSMRLEKSWGIWSRDYRPIYTPDEAALDRFVSVQKPSFIGRDAVIKAREIGVGKPGGAKQHLHVFTVEANDADVIGDEPIWLGNEVVGWVTSGGYGHHVKKSIAFGFLRHESVDMNARYDVEILGEKCAAKITAEPLYDPKGEKMRG